MLALGPKHNSRPLAEAPYARTWTQRLTLLQAACPVGETPLADEAARQGGEPHIRTMRMETGLANEGHALLAVQFP